MKTKPFDRRLSLNKTTIVNLNTDEMANARGGGFDIGIVIILTQTACGPSGSEGPSCAYSCTCQQPTELT
jgi:hypothetical protein